MENLAVRNAGIYQFNQWFRGRLCGVLSLDEPFNWRIPIHNVSIQKQSLFQLWSASPQKSSDYVIYLCRNGIVWLISNSCLVVKLLGITIRGRIYFVVMAQECKACFLLNGMKEEKILREIQRKKRIHCYWNPYRNGWQLKQFFTDEI